MSRCAPDRRRATATAVSLAVGVLLPLGAAAPAGATTVVYRDGNDVHLASPDGTLRRQVTSDGSANAYYTLPSADDAGNVVAIQGSGTSRMIVRFPVDGSTPQRNVMPWRIGSGVNAGPTWSRVSPSGTSLAYGYLYNRDIFSAMTPTLAVVDPRAPGSPTSPTVNVSGWTEGSWFGSRLLATNGTQLHVEVDGTFQPWLVAGSQSITGGDLSRDGRRVLVRFGSGVLELATLDGRQPPAGGPVTACQIQPNGNDAFSGLPRMALSADGRRVAWSDASGVHVATVERTDTPETPCRLTDRVRLSATGGMPSFSEYTLPTPGPGPGGDPDPGTDPGPGPGPGTDPDPGTGTGTGTEKPDGGTPGPGPDGGTKPGGDTTPGGTTPDGGTGVDGGTGGDGKTPADGGSRPTTPRLTLSRTPVLRASTLRRGQRLAVGTSTAGALTVELLRGRTVLARGSAKAKAGTSRATLRLTAAGRKARAVSGRRLVLRITLRPTGGTATTLRRTIRVR